MEWAYAITTCPARLDTTLPRTILSLAGGCFNRPRIYLDGGTCDQGKQLQERYDFPVEVRQEPVRTVGNWVLTLWELTIRKPSADRYAIFQDDLVCVRNLRQYLERVPYPENGYQNLYLFPSNERIAPRESPGKVKTGWYQSALVEGNDPRWQTGRGAVGLVFSREAATVLLCARSLVEKPRAADKPTSKIDGAIVTAMNAAGWKEYVHYPSLLQHTGTISSMGNNPHPKAGSFPGETFDAMSLLEDIGHARRLR